MLGSIFNKQNLKRYVLVSLTLMIPVNFLLGYFYFQLFNTYKITNEKMVLKNIEEYGEVDLEYICKITNCVKIHSSLSYYNNKTYIPGEYDILIQSREAINQDYVFNSVHINSNKNIVIYYKPYELLIELNTSNYTNDVMLTFFVVNFLFFGLFSFAYFRILFIENKQHVLGMAGRDIAISDKYMRILNENLHHELNTPVAIIRGKVKNIEYALTQATANILFQTSKICSECQNIPKIETETFKMIYNAIDQITVVMERMSNFKQIKYSNGNKTIYDILYYASHSMTVFNKSNFTYEISEDFKRYSLKHNNIANGDLLNIVSNHLRNSLEATSSKIIFDCTVIKDVMHLFIIDNGEGIVDSNTGLIVSKKNYNKVFDPYYSSKKKDGTQLTKKTNNILQGVYNYINSLFIEVKDQNHTRGVGLYLNRQILLDAGGDLVLRETSEKGTVFQLTFKVNLKEK